jgi:hypothetical protein
MRLRSSSSSAVSCLPHLPSRLSSSLALSAVFLTLPSIPLLLPSTYSTLLTPLLSRSLERPGFLDEWHQLHSLHFYDVVEGSYL